MFWYLLNRIETHFHTLEEENARLRVLLRALESRLDKMNISTCIVENEKIENNDSTPAAHDPLLHLSFENPETIVKDPSLEINIK